MKKIFLILLCVPLIGLSQKTYVPDDNFEQAIINLGADNILDDSVLTSSIDTITALFVFNNNISSLVGIEDFVSLQMLRCSGNQLSTLDLSNNNLLAQLFCRNSILTDLNIKNGNNIALDSLFITNNPNLSCIEVNNINYFNNNFAIVNENVDSQHYFSTDCTISTLIEDTILEKKISKISDILGRESVGKRNTPLFYIYDDGTVEKRIVIE